ncbi:MAG: hypothetical protein ACYDD4_01440 [Acidimicrobiales bacterium]
MVSGLLHNACLRMEAEGTRTEDVVTTAGIHRWLGRSGFAVGGAASLIFGAVLGGALNGIPVFLPPPAAAASTPLVMPSGESISAPLEMVANAGSIAPAVASARGAAAAVSATQATNGSGVHQTLPVPSMPKPVTGGPLKGTQGGTTTTTTNQPSGNQGGSSPSTVDQVTGAVSGAAAAASAAAGAVVSAASSAVGSSLSSVTVAATSTAGGLLSSATNLLKH